MITSFSEQRGGSNTPAQNTTPKSMRVLVDWISVSFYAEKNIDEILQLFGVFEMEVGGERKRLEFEMEEYSRYRSQGYKITYKYGHMEFHHDPDGSKFLVSFSGQGCREFDVISNLNYEQLFSILICYFQATFNRIDIAIDDFKSVYKVNTIRKAVFNGQVKTKIRKWGSRLEGLVAEPGVLTMDNFYFGDISSRYSINIYDKKLERKEKMNTLKTGQVLLDDFQCDSWTRTEIRFKEDYATKFAREIALNESGKPLGILVKEFLNQSICFLKRKVKDGNKSRLSKDVENYTHWWKKFLGDVGKLNLSQRSPDKSFYKSMKWFDRQLASTFGAFYELSPESFKLVSYAFALMGRKRLSDDHKMMIKVAKDDNLNVLDLLKHFVDDETYEILKRVSDKRLDSIVEEKTIVRDSDYKDRLLDTYWSQVEEQEKKLTSDGEQALF